MKEAQRERAAEARDHIPLEVRRAASVRAAAQLMNAPRFAAVRTIAVYAAFRSEADPIDLASAMHARGGRVLYPKVEGDALAFFEARLEELQTGRFGVPEPTSSASKRPLFEADLMIVPGLAFSIEGHRIGYGAGYYDRVLLDVRRHPQPPIAIGFGFSAQLLDEVPHDEHDQTLDAFVGDDGIVAFSERARVWLSDPAQT